MPDPARPRALARTKHWLDEQFRSAISDERGHRVFGADGRPCAVTPYAFRRLLRKLKILRWLQSLEFDTFLDVASGWEHLPYLVRERCGAEGFYSDLIEELNLPTDGIHYGKLDHAVTLELPVLPFRDDAFDVVLCSEVLEHLVRPIEAIAELMRITRRYLILTSLEALSVNRWQRWWSHHRVDVRIPHVERNFFLLDELHAIFGDGLHTENLFSDLTLPVSVWEPPDVQRRVHQALSDPDALPAALCRAVSAGGHGTAAFGVLIVKAMPGCPLPPPRPEADEELARWLIAKTAEEEQFVETALAVETVFRRDPSKRPRELAADRPVAPSLLARLRCPRCRGALTGAGAGAECTACAARYAAHYGVPRLLPGPDRAAVPSPEECLDRLCGADAARRRTVTRIMDRLRRNERPPGLLRRAAWQVERRLLGAAPQEHD